MNKASEYYLHPPLLTMQKIMMQRIATTPAVTNTDIKMARFKSDRVKLSSSSAASEKDKIKTKINKKLRLYSTIHQMTKLYSAMPDVLT